MKILEYNDYLDLEAPVFMSNEQKEKFITFFKNLFPEINIKQAKEQTKEIGEREIKPQRWSLEEYAMLLSPKDNDLLASKTKRTRMSILMQRGSFVPEFLCWIKKKGIDYTTSPEVIKEFLTETGKKWKS